MKQKKILFSILAVVLCIGMLPVSVFAAIDFDLSVSNDYFTMISNKEYTLAPGVSESEIIVNNDNGTDRKIVHVFEVDATNPTVKVLPGYYGIDKLDPDNLTLDGVADKSQYWTDKKLTETVKYYEDELGYNVVGAMNTALAYDSNAPYGYMVWDGVVLGTPEAHKGAQTYLAIDKDGNCELRSMSEPLTGSEWTAISANFGWLVKDGELVTKKVERTSSDASRSMIGIKADGTLVFCQVDGRQGDAISSGLSNYEMGEMMLSLGCVNAVNCDGGGSSTFVSKREGETENTMRSIPSDGAERPTINSVIIATTAVATGIFDHANIESEYDYFAAGANGKFSAVGLDAAGFIADIPADMTFALNDASFGTIVDGVFSSNGKKGDVAVQAIYNGKVVGSRTIHVVDPDVFALTLDETVLPYGKSMTIEFACTYGADDWAVCMDGAVELSLSDTSAAELEGDKLIAATNEAIKGVKVIATYKANTAVTDTLNVTYGKGSEIVFDFENGIDGFLGVDEMYAWAKENGAPAPIQGNGNYSENTDSETFWSSDIVRNGQYALGVTLDYTNATFANWSYNMFFHVGDQIVFRDVANGKNATTLGMWVYIPEGAAGLAMQIQGVKNPDGTGGTGAHFYFTTVSGAVKNLNSCTEADIPESRWVYATCDLTQFGDFFATYPAMGNTGREPSFIRFYVKPATAATLTFYFDDFTLDYSSAVDDRVLPTISGISYATQDESVVLNNGVTINGNNIAFSAIVADNIKLDNATGKIYVDGVELKNVSVSGKYLTTTENVALNAGAHTVAFEIKDTLGNTAKAIRNFNVAGNAAVTLGGHNDSGKKAEYGSVYYVDVNVADITAVNMMTVTLALQTANTWEPQGIVTAKGFKVIDVNLNEIEQILTVIVERNGDEIDANATTLVSVPVRLWTWTGVNHVTDTPITPETQYATGYCPVVKIDCKVLTGIVNDTNLFGGSISVETMINDIVNPWHYHDAELTVLNKDASCFIDGYTNRTYCETCQSVVDWGTVIEAAHSDELITVNKDATCTDEGLLDGKVCSTCNTVISAGTVIPANGHTLSITEEFKLVCSACGEPVNTTGLVTVDDKTYYTIVGKFVKGWQIIDDTWYFFNPSTYAGYNGQYDAQAYFGVDADITYSFTNGKLDSGVWHQTVTGYRYYYGPSCYRNTWAEIDGKTYYFGNDKERLTGLQSISPNLNDSTPTYELFLFAEDGILIEKITRDGFVSHNGDMFYVRNNAIVKAGLIKLDGAYYYTSTTNGKITVNETRYVAADCIDVSAADKIAGYYTFGADGKMVIETEPETPEESEKKNGIIDGYYYVDDVVQKLGLFKYDGNYYYASTTNGKLAVNVYRYVAADCIDISAADKIAGYYTFGADGKVIFA